MEIIFCVIAFAIILAYFSGFSVDKQEVENEINSDSLVSSLIDTRDLIDGEDFENFKTSLQRILGDNYEVEVFVVNESSYQLN